MKKFATATIVIAITALLLEFGSWGALHVLSDQQDPVYSETHLFDAHRNHRLNPAFRFSSSEESRIHSPDGFRRDEAISIVKAPGTIRIFVLGTSALYGIGSAPPYPVHRPLLNDEIVTAALERLLRERLKEAGEDVNVEVVNAGVSGTKTFHHLMRLNESILDLDPDIVLNLDGHNDFYQDRLNDRWNSYTYSTNVLVDEFNGRTGYLAAFGVVRALAPHSNFFNLVEKLLKRVWYSTKVAGNTLPHTVKFDFGVINDHAADIALTARRSYLRDLWQIHQLGTYGGFDHHVFLQPEIVFEQAGLLSEADRHIKTLTEEMQGAESVALMREVRQVLPGLFREKDIPYTDLGEIASGQTREEQLYIDYCHMTPEGTARLARRMVETVYPMVVKRIEKRRLEQ